MDMKNQRKKGFTLIELLVVITIIGILAGIAFVGFGDVFGSAGRTVAQKKSQDSVRIVSIENSFFSYGRGCWKHRGICSLVAKQD
jgi:prepilin-type N-terminal cleavage/methylation domain-containing protein